MKIDKVCGEKAATQKEAEGSWEGGRVVSGWGYWWLSEKTGSLLPTQSRAHCRH